MTHSGIGSSFFLFWNWFIVLPPRRGFISVQVLRVQINPAATYQFCEIKQNVDFSASCLLDIEPFVLRRSVKSVTRSMNPFTRVQQDNLREELFTWATNRWRDKCPRERGSHSSVSFNSKRRNQLKQDITSSDRRVRGGCFGTNWELFSSQASSKNKQHVRACMSLDFKKIKCRIWWE